MALAAGGRTLTETVEGVERYPVSLRYARDFRESPEAIKGILLDTPSGAQIPLAQAADVSLSRGPMSVKSEGAIPNAWIYVDVRDRDLGSYVRDAKAAVAKAMDSGEIAVPPGTGVIWSGQFEYLQRAQQRLLFVIPLTLLAIIAILYLNTKSVMKTAIVLLAVPFSLVGAFWLLHLLGYHLSVAVWIGLIALAGLDAETGVVMLLYLDLARDSRLAKGSLKTLSDLKEAIYEGAAHRVRPKIMTASVIIAGLLPIMWSHGAGADVMKRIAAPMIGGVVTSVLLELLVYPAIYYSWRGRGLEKEPSQSLSSKM
jgi:Cu(I)/Ag(I) efflux system membrane protein CusA/SilA